MADWEDAPTAATAKPGGGWEDAPSKVTTFMKGQTAPSLSSLPDTAPSRSIMRNPPVELDQKALFEQREALEKAGGKGTPQWVDLTRKIAQAQTGRVEEAAQYAAPGGKGVAGLVDAGTGAVARRVTGEAAAREIAPSAAPEMSKAEAQAADVVRRRFLQDTEGGGPTAQEAIERIQKAREAGRPLSLMDIGGENIKGLTGNVYRQPGAPRNMLKTVTQDRASAAATRLDEEVRSKLASGTMYRTTKDLEKAQRETAMPLKEAAFKANQQIESPAIDKMLAERPDLQKAFKMAVEDMRNAGKLVSVSDAELTELAREQGITTGRGVGKGLKLEVLDYTKRALDRLIRSYKQHPETGDYATATATRKQLVKALDDADVTGRAGPNSLKPEGGLYKQYRDAWSGPARNADAIEWGKGVLKMNREAIPDEFAKFTPAEKEHAKIGLADLLREEIGTNGVTAKTIRDLARDSRNNVIKEKIRPLFRSDEEFTKFIDAVTDERAIFETDRVFTGSPTQARAIEDAGGLSTALHAAKGAVDLASGRPIAAVANYLRMKRDLGLRSNPDLNMAIAKILARPATSDGPAYLRELLLPPSQPAPETRNYLQYLGARMAP